jgi:four helix bundle protein
MLFRPFEELEVFKLAEKLADEVWDIVVKWQYFDRDTVGKQLVEATDSIGANIAEGAGRGTPKENQRFIRIARGSLNETRFWLRRAYKRSLINEQHSEKLKFIIDNLAPCLNAYLKSIGKNQTPNIKHQTLNTKH